MEVPLLALRFGISRVLDNGKAHFICFITENMYHYENVQIIINVETITNTEYYILQSGGETFGSHDRPRYNRICIITRHIITRADSTAITHSVTLRIRPTIAAKELPLVGGDVNEIEMFEEVLPLSLAVQQIVDQTRYFLVHRRAEPQLNHKVTFRRNS